MNIWTMIAGFLGFITVRVVARVLGAVGMGILTMNFVETGLAWLRSAVETAFGQIGSDVFGLMGLAGFDVFITLVISAYGGVISFLIVAGSIRRLGFLPPQQGAN